VRRDAQNATPPAKPIPLPNIPKRFRELDMIPPKRRAKTDGAIERSFRDVDSRVEDLGKVRRNFPDIAPALMGALLVISAGCGDPLLSAAAYGTPLFELAGDINPLPADLSSPRVDVVWVDPSGVRDDVPAPPETVSLALNDSSFVFSMYAKPPDAAIHQLVDPHNGRAVASFAFGEIILFEDLDADRTLRVTPIGDGSTIVSPDVYRGAQDRYVVAYIESPPAGDVPDELRGLLSTDPGYHLGVVNCSSPEAPRTSIDHEIDDPIEITVLATPTSELPFARTCLRTHPVVTTPPGAVPEVARSGRLRP
jgi:hypothetical protein